MPKIDAIELVTMRGFTEAFWGLYGEGGRAQEDVFNILENIYFEKFGEHRFSSFDAFRKKRNRALRKK